MDCRGKRMVQLATKPDVQPRTPRDLLEEEMRKRCNVEEDGQVQHTQLIVQM